MDTYDEHHISADKEHNLLAECQRDHHARLATQDELSAHFDLQLALVSDKQIGILANALEEFFQPSELAEIKDIIQAGAFFEESCLGYWAEKLSQRGGTFNESLLIDFSGESPVFQILRTNHTFRILESLFVCLATDVFEEKLSDGVLSIDIPSGVDECLSLRMARCDAWGGYKISGPSFVCADLTSQVPRRAKERLQPLVQAANRFLEDHELERLSRYAILRSEITSSDIDARFSAIGQLISHFKKINIRELSLEASLLREVVKRVIEFSISTQSHLDSYGITIPIQAWKSALGQDGNSEDALLSLSVAHENDVIVGELSRADASSPSKVGKSKDCVHRDISRIADRAHTNRIDQRLENLLVFRGWVFDYMGDVANQSDQTERPHRFDRLKQFTIGQGGLVQAIACSWIWKVLRSDVVTFYRFDHSSHELLAEAYYASGPSYENWALNHAQLVKEIGQTDRSDRSFLYRVCESGEPIISNDGSEIRQKNSELSELIDLKEAALETPASFYILPIKHGKRIIGLIECVGFRPFAFDDFSSALIDEFCELLGKYFVAQANAELVNDVRSALAPDNLLVQSDNRFELLCIAVAKYFFVHSASAWIVDPFDQNRLKLDGSTNRPFPEHFRLKGQARLSVLVNREDSLTAKALRDKKWFFGEIGSGEFSGEWLHAEAHRAFLDAGLKYIAIIPVLGPNGEPLASLTLLSKFSKFSHEWRPQVDFCARVLATGLVDMALVERVLNDGLSDTSHEIRNIAKHLARAAKKLAENFNVADVQAENNSLEDEYSPIGLYLADIEAFSDDLTAINEVMSPSEFLEFYREPGFKGSPLVRRLVEGISISEHDLRDIWNQEYETLRTEITLRSLNFDPRWRVGRARVPIDRQATSIVVRNVLGNAVKYAKLGSTVDVTITENTSRRNFQLKIANLGPHLEVEEEDRIFLRKFQGFRAKQMDSSGRGEGLYQAYAFMKAQRGDLTHRQERTTDKQFSLQTFRVTFNY